MSEPKTLDDLLKPRLLTMKIFWAALLVSMLVYLAISYTVMNHSEPRDAMWEIRIAFSIIAFVEVAAAILIPRIIFSDSRLRKKMETDITAEQAFNIPLLDITIPGFAEKAEAFSKEELKLYSLSGSIFLPYFIVISINASVVVYGLILSFIEQRIGVFLPFFAVGVILQLISYGTPKSVIERAKQMLKTDSSDQAGQGGDWASKW